MYCQASPLICFEHPKLVVKHTFLEFEELDSENSQKLRRNVSAPALPSAALANDSADYDKSLEVLTPTTCSSVSGDDDDDNSSLASPTSSDECSNSDCMFSFTGVVTDDFPQVPMPDSSRTEQRVEVWAEACQSLMLLSTSPLTPLAQETQSENPSTSSLQSTNYSDFYDDRTTLMVRNLPAELTQPAFVKQFSDAGYGGLFDFVYMPMNLRANGNFGYAFINFASNSVAAHVMMHMQRDEHDGSDSSDKWTCQWSNCQGWDANVERYRNSPLMHETVPQDCKPAVFDGYGKQTVFPEPTKRIPKPRIHFAGKEGQRN